MSSRVIDLTAKLLQTERQRDELFRANLKLRDRLLAIARACEACGGTGCEIYRNEEGRSLAVLPCAACHDIREALE